MLLRMKVFQPLSAAYSRRGGGAGGWRVSLPCRRHQPDPRHLGWPIV